MRDLEKELQDALDDVGVDARAVVMPTPWDVGPVVAYLFPTDPVTLVDAGVGTPESTAALREALAADALEPVDVRNVLVTHGHSDHFGGAAWLQGSSSCRVHMHPADIATSDPSTWAATGRDLFGSLGFSGPEIERLYAAEPSPMQMPVFTPLADGEVFVTGDSRLRVEHHPGHSPGHVWIVEEASGAIFVGDYLIADHPTNAGMEVDRTQPMGRAPLLEQYNAGLRELRTRGSPALFPGHGPPIADKAEVIDRRLAKSARRTRHVLESLRKHPEVTALGLAKHMYGERPLRSWEVMADVIGRLDLLVDEGAAKARLGEDGAWYFRPSSNEGRAHA